MGEFMERNKRSEKLIREIPVLFLGKCLLFSYILTGGLLMLLALLLYRFNLSERIVSICIIGVYVIVTFFAGFMAGKRIGNRKFIWGLLMGVAYFIVLAIVSLIVNHSIKDVANNFFSILILCAGSGMLGGMLG